MHIQGKVSLLLRQLSKSCEPKAITALVLHIFILKSISIYFFQLSILKNVKPTEDERIVYLHIHVNTRTPFTY